MTTANYTKEQVQQMKDEYLESPTRETVEHIAEVMGKSTRSVIGKLSNEGVYVKAVKVTKSGKPSISKKDLVNIINEHYGFEMPSLVKATKSDLNLLVTNLSN